MRGPAVTAAAVSVTLVLAACGQTGRPAGPPRSASGNGGFTIGVLMPDQNATRYQTFDKPLIEKKVKELCSGCTVEYANAQNDASTQRQQMNTMLNKGARVLILDRVDAGALRRSVQQARDAGVPVISYDRLADGPVSGYVSYDDYDIGVLQGQALIQGMGNKAHGGQVVWIDATEPPSPIPSRRTGGMSVLKGKVDIEHVITNATISPHDAYATMSAAIARLGPHRIDGVYAINDAVAAGAISALKAAHVTPLPPVVGQDAELSAIQRIVRGEQYMTVYKPYEPEADAAAEMAVALGRGEKLDGIARTTVGNSTTKDIPAVLLTPVPVNAKNVKATVVKNGMYTIKQICTPEVAAACRKGRLT
ncbi:substrate-binding domain-containing protein [Streptomyces sp. PSKA28]|uniref:Substrate-binding domain-containing protein n=1 Tax=Streptomyces himalayensis subsp. himalayensis TaxID=2756131 RepID=A0A7W0DSE6_9ACTN|nr:substrate-binding domain-containing protein [Streptomyces himalayensis subsp. himalayensis]